MKQFDEKVKQALEASVEHVSFSRHEAVARAVREQTAAEKSSSYRLFFKPVLAYAAAFVVITTIALGGLLWVPGASAPSPHEQVITAGEIPFAAVQHLIIE